LNRSSTRHARSRQPKSENCNQTFSTASKTDARGELKSSRTERVSDLEQRLAAPEQRVSKLTDGR